MKRYIVPCLVALWVGVAAASAAPPNVLFVFSDDHALRTIGAYDSSLHTTPNIDRLAAEGAVFTRSYCANSICQPSRATILTGKHSYHNGMLQNGSRWNGNQQVFTRLLKEAGYQTALFGKWHMHPAPTTEFDTWEILAGAGGQGYYYNPRFLTPEGEVQREGYSTDLITDRSLKWLAEERDPDRPFFLMCQFKNPHVPRMPALRFMDRYEDQEMAEPATLFDDYQSRHHAATAWMMVAQQPDFLLNIFPSDGDLDLAAKDHKALARMTPEQRTAYLGAYAERNRAYGEKLASGELEGTALKRYRYQRFIKDYLRCTDAIDENVGRLTAWLEEQGLSQNTVVIYSSDQGYFTGEHGFAEKRWMYEEALVMPFIIRWPGGVKPGIRPDALIQNIDYAPTFLELAGLPVPDDMQGRSLLPLFQGETPADWRTSLYYHYYHHGAHNVPRHEGVRTQRHKLIHFYTDNTWELYDLRNDPHEVKNLYDHPEYAALRKKLTRELGRLRDRYEIPAPTTP